MSTRAIESWWRVVLGVAVIALGASLAPAAAQAVDTAPCGGTVLVAWAKDPVQPCDLAAPTGPNGSIPVYRVVNPNPRGHAVPPAAGWIRGLTGKYFICERTYTAATFYHPKGWFNNTWAYTRGDNGVFGWVPEVYFKGGGNNEPDGGVGGKVGLRSCTTSAPKPQPQPQPEPSPPVSSCEPTPAAEGAQLQAVVGKKKRRTITASFGRKLSIGGELLGSDGAPRPGVGLCVGQQVTANSSVQAFDQVSTDESGRFSYRLPTGPSRRIWFVRREGGAAVATSVLVRVRAPVRLRASRRSLHNNESVVLRGSLGADVPARGLLVEMQAARGKKWQTFATTNTRGNGRFKYTYRFTRTLGVQRYKLRARIRSQPGSAFATGSSRAVKIRVSG